ncbi:MAG: hypothetical protein AABY10_04285 [Nanoarchaeota archaeon]
MTVIKKVLIILSFAILITNLVNAEELSMNVNSPNLEFYSQKNIAFNITLSEKVDILSYINFDNFIPKETILCKNCREYGFSKKVTKSFKEGYNDFLITARTNHSETSFPVYFILDSKKPMITSTLPKAKSFFSGDFEVNFREDNTQEIKLIYGNKEKGYKNETLDIQDCPFQGSLEIKCRKEVNLEEFNGKKIDYHFTIKDKGNLEKTSKSAEVSIDTDKPIIKSFNYTLSGKGVEFFIGLEEKNPSSVYFLDFFQSNREPRKVMLCSKMKNSSCKINKRLDKGTHPIILIAEDKAGNIDEEMNVIFVNA